jgi:hypothetical protein
MVKAENNRDPCGKYTNKKTKMGSWRIYAFQMKNSGLIQISMKIQRYFESARPFNLRENCAVDIFPSPGKSLWPRQLLKL